MICSKPVPSLKFPEYNVTSVVTINNKSPILLFSLHAPAPTQAISLLQHAFVFTRGRCLHTKILSKRNALENVDSFLKLCRQHVFTCQFIQCFSYHLCDWTHTKAQTVVGMCEVCGGGWGRLGQADAFRRLLSPWFPQWEIAFIDPLLSDLSSREVHLMSFSLALLLTHIVIKMF